MAKKSMGPPLNRRTFILGGACAGVSLMSACSKPQTPPTVEQGLVRLEHAPKKFSRRATHFTVCFTGIVRKDVTQTKYRVNGGDWVTIQHDRFRMPHPWFTIEIHAAELKTEGTNVVEVQAFSDTQNQSLKHEFSYDDSPIVLPFEQRWDDAVNLDVQEGYWEVFEDNGINRVRPRKDFEWYDRLIAVTGAFAGARRIEAEFVYRYRVERYRPFGFGLMPLWGGRPDDVKVRPLRGWSFLVAWYYSHYNGAGLEVSYKDGAGEPAWISSYRSVKLEKGVPYRVVAEVWPVKSAEGKHLHYKMRMKWIGDNVDTDWIQVTDVEGAPLPEGEYSVACLIHRCQVEIGPIKVTALEKSETEKSEQA